MSVGHRLREQRKRAQLTLGQVAEYEGLSTTYLSALERGVNDPNVWHLLARLAERYHTSTDYLLGLEPGRDAGLLEGLDSAAARELQVLIAELRQLTPAEQRTVLATARTIQRLYEPHIVGEDPAPDDAPGAAG